MGASAGQPAPRRIDLGRHGWLELLPEEDGLVHLAPDGVRHSFGRHPLLDEPGALRWQLSSCGDALLIGRVAADRLHWLDLRQLRFEMHGMVERLARAEQLELVASGDLLLAISENGIVAIESRGGERWRVCRTTHGWRFVGRADASLCFVDALGDLRSLDARSGEESSF